MNAPIARRLLFVDDQASLLQSMRLSLRPFEAQWVVETAEGGRAGLEALQRGSFDAVITNARMPDVNGDQVLAAARQHHPGALRIVLAGQVDTQTGRCLAPLAHQFLVKPASGWAVIASIESAARAREIVADPTLIDTIASTGNLPVAPQTYYRLSAMIDSGDARIEDIASVVSESIALSTTLLRLVGSAYFAFARTVSSVQEAVTLLGLETVREVVLLMEVFPEVDPFGLFQHVQRDSLFRSRLARLVAGRGAVASMVAEAALLADVGIYVLAMRMPDRYRPLWTRARREGVSIRDLEREALGFTHEQVGAALLRLWNLPASVVTAVATGHDLPPKNAKLDSGTIQALTILLEEEARGVEGNDKNVVAEVANQLGVGPQLAELRVWAAKQWGRSP